MQSSKIAGMSLVANRPTENLPPASMQDGTTVSVHFGRHGGWHGIGDATNFAHLAALYHRRGYQIEAVCNPDHAPILRAAGIKIIGNATAQHLWPESPDGKSGGGNSYTAFQPPWTGNKNAYNISRTPLPNIGSAAELWSEYASVKIDFETQVTAEDRAAVDLLLFGAQRPVILAHTKGYGWGSYRNYPDHWTIELHRKLLDRTGGTIINIDREAAAPHVNCAKITNFKHFPIGQLYEAIRRADLLIGIDSGPLNFARFTNTPALGIWGVHYPSTFALPREQTLHCVASRHRDRDKYERAHWNTVLAPDDGPAPAFVAEQALRMLGEPRYSATATKARDAQLQYFVDKTCSSFRADFAHAVDRHMSFDLALKFLGTKREPIILETGTIRSEEDWAGAGFSTYLWGAFVQAHGGHVYGADLNPAYLEFAHRWTDGFRNSEGKRCVTLCLTHSHRLLESWNQSGNEPPIDLFYSDSADTTTEGYMECCLGEVQRVQPHLASDARILIDDTPPDGAGKWKGKGALAVPYLISNGWAVEFSGWQVLLRRL